MAKILFIQKEWSLTRDNIGVTQLSAVLKQNGHETDMLLVDASGHPCPEERSSAVSRLPFLSRGLFRVLRESSHFKKSGTAARRLMDYASKYDPDIIGFSVMTINSEWTLKIASLLKENGTRALIVAGGPHPTFFKDYINNDCLDAINVGEGEYSLLELADAIDKKADMTRIKNLRVKKDGKIYKNPLRPLIDINKLPFPDRDLYMKYKSFREQEKYNFVVSRGCPYGCSFCFAHQWKREYKGDPHRNTPRLRSIDSVIDEIKDLAKRVNLERIYFSDSTFNLDKNWMMEFLRRYSEEIHLPYTINTRADLLDEESAKAIADSGCCESVRVGIETGNEKNRKHTLGKNISNQQIYETIDLLKKHGVRFVSYSMYGLPGETFEEAMETIEMLQKIQPYSMNISLFHPYPGLNITKKAIRDGYLGEGDFVKLDNHKYKVLKSILRQPDIDSVVNLMQLSVFAVRFPFLWPLIKKTG